MVTTPFCPCCTTEWVSGSAFAGGERAILGLVFGDVERAIVRDWIEVVVIDRDRHDVRETVPSDTRNVKVSNRLAQAGRIGVRAVGGVGNLNSAFAPSVTFWYGPSLSWSVADLPLAGTSSVVESVPFWASGVVHV
jgi:hypothetical protein